MFKKLVLLLLLIGLVFTIIGFVLLDGDFTKIVDSFSSDEDYAFKEVQLEESFNKVNIDLTSNNIVFEKATDNKLKVEFYESEYDKINVTIESDTLNIIGKNKHKFRLFGLNLSSREKKTVTIYLPSYKYEVVTIEITSGGFKLEDFDISKLNIEITSGNVSLNNLLLNSIDVSTTSGTVTISNTKVTNTSKFHASSGDLNIKDSELKSIRAVVTSGSIDLNKIKSDHLDVEATSGKVNINLVGIKDDYKADLSITSGNIYYDGIKISNQVFNNDKSKTIKAYVTSGSIIINFISE